MHVARGVHAKSNRKRTLQAVGKQLRVNADIKTSSSNLNDMTVQWIEETERKGVTVTIGDTGGNWREEHLEFPISPAVITTSRQLIFTVRARAGNQVRLDKVAATLSG